MAKRAYSGSQRSIASIDGFDEPFERTSSGSVEPEARTAEPEIVVGIPTASPDELIDGGTGGDGYRGSPGRRRGRPIGSKNASKQAPQNIAEHLESLLLSVHVMASAMLSTPEIALEPSEAKTLADAIRDVAKYYPVVFDPKKIAIANLSVVLVSLYGTRGVAIWKKHNQAPKPQAVPQPIRPPVSTGGQNGPRVETPVPAQPIRQGTNSTTITVPSQINPDGVEDLSII